MAKKRKNSWINLKSCDFKLWLEYGVLALAIMAPILLRPGYVFALDMVFGPKIPAPTQVSNTYLRAEVLHWLNFAVPSQVIEKLMLCAIIVVAGVGMHRLIDTDNRWARYFGGLFYVVNPYTYQRFMAGQYELLAAYALLPYFVRQLWLFVKNPLLSNGVKTAIFAVAIAMLSLHAIGFVVVFAAVFGAIYLVKYLYSNRAQALRLLGYGAAAAAIFGLANLFWLVPVLRGHSSISTSLNNFSEAHFQAFRTAGDPVHGTLVNVGGLYGMWTERDFRVLLPKYQIPFWWAILLLILVLVVIGAVQTYRRYDKLITAGLLVCLLIGLALSLGRYYGVVSWLNNWLIRHVMYFRGYREPEKWSALLAFAYSFFGGWGVYAVLRHRFRQRWIQGAQKYLPGLLLFVPILYTPTMFWGFGGQLPPSQYPQSWSSAQQIIEHDPGNYRILFLPWHQYMKFGFTSQVVASPAALYFGPRTIVSDNGEFGQVVRDHPDPQSDFIQNRIIQADDRSQTAADLKRIGVKYVILAHVVDYQRYQWLDSAPNMAIVYQSPDLTLYQNHEF